MSLFGTYRERYRQAFNFNPNAFNPANAPKPSDFNADGSLAQNAGKTINPLNGFVQCGGAGGTLPLVPGSAFPNVSIGSSSSAGCLSGHLFNPAPRIGFAFDPKGDGKMVIRGGYGIFYEHTNGNEGNTESLEGSPPLVLSATQSNVAVGLNGCPAGANGGYACVGGGGGQIPFFPLSVVSIPNKAVWPSVQHCNLNVACGLVSSVAAVRTAFPGFNNINTLRDAADSIYHSLQVGARRTVGDLTLSLAYTYSHSIDDSSDRAADVFVNAYDLANNRASSNFDLRHNLSISYVYGLP